jgi:carbon monoxide dehydrogenase subunit G
MKFLKYFFLVAATLLILFFVMGLIKPSVDYGHTIQVDKPIKEAWAVVEDPSKLSLWLDGFVSETLISGEANQVGAKYKVVVKPSTEEDAFEMIETITSRTEFEHIDMHFESDFGTFDQKMTFAEKEGGTEIKTESVVKGKNLAMSAMMGWMETLTGSFKDKEVENIEKLKNVINQNETNYYSNDSVKAGI